MNTIELFYKKLPILITMLYSSNSYTKTDETNYKILETYTKRNDVNLFMATNFARAIHYFIFLMVNHNLLSENENLSLKDIRSQIIDKKTQRQHQQAQSSGEDFISNKKYASVLKRIFKNDPTGKELLNRYKIDGFMNTARYEKYGRSVLRTIGWSRGIKKNGYYGILFYFPLDKELTVLIE